MSRLLISLALLALAACADKSAPQVNVAVTGAEPSATQPVEQSAEPAPGPDEAPPVAVSAPGAPGHVDLKYLIGDVEPANDPVFARIPQKYIAGSRVWGHKDAVEAFVRMAEAAAANGYPLTVVSAFRSFDDQKQIWNDKWTGKTLVERGKLPRTIPDPKRRAIKILEFSSMPGTSRHHWGTDFDLNSLSNAYFNTRDGKRIHDWLTLHAPEYGFCQVYSDKREDGRTGYEEEKWHWSYLPVASWYLKQYPSDVGYERLTGFEGAEAAKDIDVIRNYVQGISSECK